MATHTIKLSDEGYEKLKELSDELNVLRKINLEETDTDDWIVDILCKISFEYVMKEKIKSYKRKFSNG